MSANYFVLKQGNYKVPGVMLVDREKGTIFIDRKATPYEGYGLYKTKTSGKDKHDKPFTIVVPVLPFTEEIDDIRIWLQYYVTCNSHYTKHIIDCANYSRRFNKRNGRNIEDKVTADDVANFIDTQSIAILQDVISRPLGNLDKDNFVVSFSQSDDSVTVKWDQSVMVAFTSGEVHMKPVSWVVQNKDHLILTNISVVGDTIDNLSVIITRSK